MQFNSRMLNAECMARELRYEGCIEFISLDQRNLGVRIAITDRIFWPFVTIGFEAATGLYPAANNAEGC